MPKGKSFPLVKVEPVEVKTVLRSGKTLAREKPEVFCEAKDRPWGIIHEFKVSPGGQAL
ncbi:MAG: hypothetical protein KA354_09890 [Phycisphaerae bacterium]|nr:hypothetical protein [Phycisphaerae bacterium]